MDANDRKAFKRLPDEITIYRGILEGHTVNGLSWSLDRDKASWFAKRFTHYNLPHVLLTARAKKSDAHALLLGRKEDEIVIDQFEIVATAHVT
jgi:3-methyladenine DNA glycosylase Tag